MYCPAQRYALIEIAFYVCLLRGLTASDLTHTGDINLDPQFSIHLNPGDFYSLSIASLTGQGGEALVDIYDFTFVADGTSVNPVPIPAAAWLFGTALIGLVGFGRRRKAA